MLDTGHLKSETYYFLNYLCLLSFKFWFISQTSSYLISLWKRSASILKRRLFSFFAGIRGVSFVHSPLLSSAVAGSVHHSLMHISDWFPTIIEGILGDSLPANLSLDGVNMWDSISIGTKGQRTEILHNIDPMMPHPGKLVTTHY